MLCPLPVGCESSYESAEAHIRFFARAILKTEKREKFIMKKAFSIVSPPDLHHLVPPHSEPITRKGNGKRSRNVTVHFGGGCCCRNKISAEVELAKSAFASGEDIVGAFYIDSRTARNAVEHGFRYLSRQVKVIWRCAESWSLKALMSTRSRVWAGRRGCKRARKAIWTSPLPVGILQFLLIAIKFFMGNGQGIETSNAYGVTGLIASRFSRREGKCCVLFAVKGRAD
ncbi:hypothetical protein GPALN_014424 [Globodera pallida]|nr:hypothetical protein GPALN_014424 [Globodera pallida]